jgi:hypothetical protein
MKKKEKRIPELKIISPVFIATEKKKSNDHKFFISH